MATQAPSVRFEGLPDSGRCYFAVLAAPSPLSEEAIFDFDTQAQIPSTPSAKPAVTWAAAPPVGLVSALSRPYQIGTLAAGQLVYLDRAYTFTTVPPLVGGLTYIRTANNDKTLTANPFLTFQLSRPATVYVAWDTRSAVPTWLSSWAARAEILSSTDPASPLRLYEKEFAAGLVSLGPANNASGGGSLYSVIVR